jgi:hypothetical protein
VTVLEPGAPEPADRPLEPLVLPEDPLTVPELLMVGLDSMDDWGPVASGPEVEVL